VTVVTDIFPVIYLANIFPTMNLKQAVV